MSLLYSAVSWSALNDCGIFMSYSLTIWSFLIYYNQKRLPDDNQLFVSTLKTVNYRTTIIAIVDLFKQNMQDSENQ